MTKHFFALILLFIVFTAPTVAQKLPPNKNTYRSSSFADFHPQIADRYYPADEARYRAHLQIPSCASAAANKAVLRDPQSRTSVRLFIGESISGWKLVETLTVPKPIAILERNFPDWGLIVYVDNNGLVAEIRKAIGQLDTIHEPKISFPENYFEQLTAAQSDVLRRKSLSRRRRPVL